MIGLYIGHVVPKVVLKKILMEVLIMNYVYYGYLFVAFIVSMQIIMGKGNRMFSVAYMSSIIIFLTTGFLYLYFSYHGINDPIPAYHSISALAILLLLHWAKRSFNVKLFDRRFR